MTKGRLEAFSDGVLAIIITIMVLELSVPHGADVAALRPLAPKLLSYLLSFAFLGLYWNNHHHLFQAIKRVDGRVLWGGDLPRGDPARLPEPMACQCPVCPGRPDVARP